MTIINQNFVMYSGETKTIVAPVTNYDGTGFDSSGATCKWVIRPDERDVQILLLKQAPDVDFSGNTLQITLNPADTAAMEGTYYHECKVTDQFGDVAIIFTGQVSIEKTGI